MDVQMSLLAIGVACATAIAVYLVSVFGIREKSFEEAIAEQKKRSDDLLGTHHHHKKDKKKLQNKDKNSNKKLKKREKLNNNVGAVGLSDLSDGGEAHGNQIAVDEEVVVASKSEQQHAKRSHVEIVDEPEILDEDDEVDDEVQQQQGSLGPPRTQSRRSSVTSVRRDSIIKSILLNKDEVAPTSTKEQTEPANHFDQIVPKDDCELKKSNSELQLSTPDSPRLGNAPPSGSNTPVDEQQTTTDSPQVSKRSRSKQKKSQDDDTMTAGKIEKVIDRLALTSSEIQQLIDVLLNKQHAGDNEWINKGNKGDSVGGLKKQLELKDKMIAEEQATVSTLQAKLKELRNEFSTEKNKWAGVRRTLEEQVQGKVTELQNLQLRLKQVGDIGMSEKQELQRQLHRMQIQFKDVQGEYEAMKADYRNYREAEQTVRSKADTLERESGALKTQCGHLENQLKNAFASNQEMSNQLRSLQEHVRVMEERKKNDEILRTNDFRKLQEREGGLLQELAALKATLTTCENENRELRNQLNVVESSAKGADEINKKYEELRKSEVSLRNLVNELKGTVGGLEDQLKAKDKRIEELEKENERVKNEGSKLNGDVKNEVDGLRKDLEGEMQAAKVLRGQVEELKKEVDEKKVKNDELRHKNQKLLESLQVTEQSLQGKIEASEKLVKQQENIKQQASGVINQILGDSADLSTEDWLINVLRRVQEKVTALKNAPPPEPQVPQADPKEVEDLKQKSSKLEDEVVHYQGMLKQTENLLSTLQASINAEEAKWVSQTADKDKEIERLRSANNELKELEQEKLILESKVNELEERLGNSSATSSEVEQLKKSNDSLKSELESVKSKCEQLSIALARLESNPQPAASTTQEPYTNGSTSVNDDSSCTISSNSSVNSNKQQQLSPPVSPNVNSSSTTAQAPPSPNPSTSSPGSVGKEKKKKKNSSRK